MIEHFTASMSTMNAVSKFKSVLSEKGGYVTLSNTSGKDFVLGLESFIKIFEDIRDNQSEFSSIQDYVEREWRDNGSEYFNDSAANTMSTVQTKPLFTTLSKINSIANEVVSAYNDNKFIITPTYIDKTITYLKELLELYTPTESEISSSVMTKYDTIESTPNLRKIIFESFIYSLNEFKEDDIVNGYTFKQSKIEDRSYTGIMLPKYFGNENLIGIFEELQTGDSLKSANTARFINEHFKILDKDFSYFTNQWNETGDNGKKLNLVNYNLFLSDISSGSLKIISEDGVFKLIKFSKAKFYNKNVIFFGAPGTGKSHEVKEILKDVSPDCFERIIFHPEYDYTSFVGGYKPVTVFNTTKNENEIQYNFQPEVFTNMYVKAWQNTQKHFYLAIEEINRGNCAEIFGDIFQLLDRNAEYSITPSGNLQKYLEIALGDGNDGFKDGKMTMPENLTILATMNTSDQSLFPMDSAFKRRWDWEYVPIITPADENDTSSDSYAFVVMLNDKEGFRWIDFMEQINRHIASPYIGMDKCLGNYFIKPDTTDKIEIRSFIHKVIFYLWNDVFKDEENEIFEGETTYHSFFPVETKGDIEIRKILTLLDVEVSVYSKTSYQGSEEDSGDEQITEGE